MFIPPKKAADKRRSFYIALFLLAWYNEIVMNSILIFARENPPIKRRIFLP